MPASNRHPRSAQHVRSSAELGADPDTRVPLCIRFLDPVQGIKIGKDFRFEVFQGDPQGGVRVAVDRLDFSFTPVSWGEVRIGADPHTGIVHVIAVHQPADVYDRPKYEMAATFRARGGATVETVHRFALAISTPVVELRFYIRDEEGVVFEEFYPQQQRRPLDPEHDIRVSPPTAAEVFAEGERIYLRVLEPRTRAQVVVRFPNDEEARLELDLARAGEAPSVRLPPADEEAQPSGPVAAARAPATAPVEPLTTFEPFEEPEASEEPEALETPEAADVSETPEPPTPTPAPARLPPSPAPSAPPFASPLAADVPDVAPVSRTAPAVRKELAAFRREVEFLRSTGCLALDGARLKRHADTLAKAVRLERGPEGEELREILSRTMREAGL